MSSDLESSIQHIRILHIEDEPAYARLIKEYLNDVTTYSFLITWADSIQKALEYIENDEHYVECEVWAENEKGEKAVLSTALVALPARAGTTT